MYLMLVRAWEQTHLMLVRVCVNLKDQMGSSILNSERNKDLIIGVRWTQLEKSTDITHAGTTGGCRTDLTTTPVIPKHRCCQHMIITHTDTLCNSLKANIYCAAFRVGQKQSSSTWAFTEPQILSTLANNSTWISFSSLLIICDRGSVKFWLAETSWENALRKWWSFSIGNAELTAVKHAKLITVKQINEAWPSYACASFFSAQVHARHCALMCPRCNCQY